MLRSSVTETPVKSAAGTTSHLRQWSPLLPLQIDALMSEFLEAQNVEIILY